MPVNLDKPLRWKNDIQESIDLYNNWFMTFAPQTYRETRVRTTEAVERAFKLTDDLKHVTPDVLLKNPQILPILRMTTAPPIARDRLVGLAGVRKNLVDNMENAFNQRLSRNMDTSELRRQLEQIGRVIERLADRDLFPWLAEARVPTDPERFRASSIVADRLCGAQSDPIIRNAQEAEMLRKLKEWFENRNYREADPRPLLDNMTPGTFAFRLNAEGKLDDGSIRRIPIDIVVLSHSASPGSLPLMIEAKSAGDFTNVNKRRKEEANKVANLRRRYGSQVRFVLFLRGYFDSGYLGYAASEGIDWFWEHRMDDLAQLGV
ncbi:MAG: hypothetical protein KatS3mg059_0192 [Thermomicrobiales bacterium]|nr:MAG: hypothetical protein KatS3mg059_0192 [Thermomicrobiales bacterium]